MTYITISRGVRAVAFHPEYRDDLVAYHDVAVLTLDSPFTFTRFVRRVCLPAVTDHDPDAYDKTRVTLTGKIHHQTAIIN